MQKINKLVLLILFILPMTVMGQNYINNPYTRFGIGDLINTGFSYNRALGGSSVALRLPNQINPLNPASFTVQDTLSFLFQGGFSAQHSRITTDLGKDNANTMNFEYLAMGFPITRWFKFSLGLIPFSRMNYLYLEYQPEASDVAIENSGYGGFNDFYFGGSIQPLKFLSLGFSAQYMFGKLNQSTMVDIPGYTVAGTQIKKELVASDFHYRLGLQVHPSFTDKSGKKHQIVLGASYDLPFEFNLGYNSIAARNFPSHVSNPILDTFNIVKDSTILLKFPAKIGFGLSYTYNERITLTAEYSNQAFSEGIGDVELAGIMNDYSSVRFGIDYIPVPVSSKERSTYIERIHYVIGGHYTNTYIRINDTPVKDYGVSVGFNLPLRNQQKLYTLSTFSLTYEYGVRGTTSNGLIKDNYHLVTFGLTLHDYWFMKAKYD